MLRHLASSSLRNLNSRARVRLNVNCPCILGVSRLKSTNVDTAARNDAQNEVHNINSMSSKAEWDSLPNSEASLLMNHSHSKLLDTLKPHHSLDSCCN